MWEEISPKSEDKKSQFYSNENPMLDVIPSLQVNGGSASKKYLEFSWLEPNEAGGLIVVKTKYTTLLYITRWLLFTPKQCSELLYSDPSVD